MDFNLDNFIAKHVTEREESMFLQDMEAHREELTQAVKGKSVLVIGGAGSIGSSFIRALLPYEPATLVVADTNENGLAELTRDIRSRGLFVPEDYVPYPMDYSSGVFEKMFRARGGFSIVANFSAHKHVRSEKDIYSVEALFTNNVLCAKKFLDLLTDYPPGSYFCVSTDKAANPVNLMGASKRIMEDLIFSYSDQFPVKTARFANVAFSNGSLPDGFLHRLSRQQPLTAPTDVRRFFVSPEESGQICFMACVLGKNREIFFPKLREDQTKRFDEIATALLKEYGYEPLLCNSDAEAVAKMKELAADATGDQTFAHDAAGDHASGDKGYPVHYFTSDTSGEKPYEEFYVEGEALDMERFSSLGVITDKDAPPREQVTALTDRMKQLFQQEGLQKEDLVEAIAAYLPNFAHIETGKGLDQRM